MKLNDKGRFAPPPRLRGPAQKVAEAVAAWPRVHARTHWLLGDERVVDGADFYLGEEELGHLHLEGEAHVFVPLSVAKALIAAGLADRMPWAADAVIFSVQRAADVAHALWLFELSYARREGASAGDLLARIRSRIPSGAGGS